MDKKVRKKFLKIKAYFIPQILIFYLPMIKPDDDSVKRLSSRIRAATPSARMDFPAPESPVSQMII